MVVSIFDAQVFSNEKRSEPIFLLLLSRGEVLRKHVEFLQIVKKTLFNKVQVHNLRSHEHISHLRLERPQQGFLLEELTQLFFH